MPAPYFPPACTPFGEKGRASYAYDPSIAAGVVFCVLFGISAVLHTWQLYRTRAYWLLFFVVGAGLETLGWIGRAKGHDCAYSRQLFTMQTAVLIMGPAWTQAGIYIVLWRLINILGRNVSPIPAATYLITTLCADVVCLTLQATGGGLAGSASSKGKSTTTGTTIMVVGIIAQLVLACFLSGILSIIYARGAAKIRANRPLVLVSASMVIAIAMIICRGVYRSIELVQGWHGYLISREGYVIALDGVPIIIAMGIFNLWNPAALYQKYEATEGRMEESKVMERNQDEQSVSPLPMERKL